MPYHVGIDKEILTGCVSYLMRSFTLDIEHKQGKYFNCPRSK